MYGKELEGRHLGLRRTSQEPPRQKHNFCQEAHLRTHTCSIEPGLEPAQSAQARSFTASPLHLLLVTSTPRYMSWNK